MGRRGWWATDKMREYRPDGSFVWCPRPGGRSTWALCIYFERVKQLIQFRPGYLRERAFRCHTVWRGGASGRDNRVGRGLGSGGGVTPYNARRGGLGGCPLDERPLPALPPAAESVPPLACRRQTGRPVGGAGVRRDRRRAPLRRCRPVRRARRGRVDGDGHAQRGGALSRQSRSRGVGAARHVVYRTQLVSVCWRRALLGRIGSGYREWFSLCSRGCVHSARRQGNGIAACGRWRRTRWRTCTIPRSRGTGLSSCRRFAEPPHAQWGVFLLECHAQRRCKPCCCKKQNSRNQVLAGFEPPTPGRDPKVTPNESGCLTSH